MRRAGGAVWMGQLPVLVAALGPVMLRIAEELADGTVLWVADEHVVPAITKSAEAAGSSAPRVVAGIPVCVCTPHEVDATRILGEAEVSIHLAGHEPTYGPRHASGNTVTSAERLQPEAEFGQGPRLQRSGDPLREELHGAT
ncbi:LLM class flavin-dependent oxidoreductase [Streptomyces acidiscabies]|uniref:LLM class flavin-dependent oxidoreductase n=1 Tax=Streptomyces acidiscabies TaxID=42234 RepID=UPI00076E5147|nr:LLM class flavin-dependent oxidoreductase [Streptomyces acidiscabies]GAQ50882.1 luciferase-like monooxygenase [Streptomyces acidiscabies]